MIDIKEKKRKILNFLEQNGPSLPVQVARTIQMDPVFASAILSELLHSKQIITSHMKIGSSPLYLLSSQKQKLEEKTEYLKPAEKETQEKLKENIILFDEKETPAIRIALRNIKDFAIPFKHEEKITWKYAFSTQEEIQKKLYKKEEISKVKEDTEAKEKPKIEEKLEIKKETEVPKAWEVKKEEIQEIKKESTKKPNPESNNSKNNNQTKKVENIFENKSKPEQKKSFLEEIETFLEKQNTKITSIEEVDKTKVIAIIESDFQKEILFAFNKKRITEIEIFKCYKHAKKENLSYQIITKDNQTKKLQEIINAYKSLTKIQKLN